MTEKRDAFDDVAEQLGITRNSAVLQYCPARSADLEVALEAVIHALWQTAPDVLEVIAGRIQATAQVSSSRAFSAGVEIALDAIRKKTRGPA